MSTHDDPSKDKYLEVDKRVAAAEYELLAQLAAEDEALNAAKEKGKKKAKAARTNLKRKAAAGSGKDDPDGLQKYSLEATAGRSDLTALPELVRAQMISHR